MKEKQDYIRDIAEVRSMMERSSKFFSLSGLAGIMAGIYALAGAYFAHRHLGFQPSEIVNAGYSGNQSGLLLVGLVVLLLAVGTAVYLSSRNAARRGERLWNPATRLVILNMALPLAAGGLLMLILLAKGFTGLLAPCSLVFYGLALFSAGNFTYREVRSLGSLQVLFGLLSAHYVEYSLIFWAMGFGITHIVYGIYMHFRYER